MEHLSDCPAKRHIPSREVAAELFDSYLKRLDSQEQALRFERLAHPLGTIRVAPVLTYSLAGSALSEYKARTDQAKRFLAPDFKSERAAFALLTT